MTPTESGFYWAQEIKLDGSLGDIEVVQVDVYRWRGLDASRVWQAGVEVEASLDEWEFLSGPLEPPEEKR